MEQEEHKKRYLSENDVPIRCRKKVYYDEYTIFKEKGDIDCAAESLTSFIREENTKDSRKKLRELYSSKSNGSVDAGYLKVIEDNIEGGISDYVIYLKSQGRINEAVHWLIKGGELNEAFFLIDLENIDLIKAVSNEFRNTYYEESVFFMQNKFLEIRNTNLCTRPPRYISVKYLFLHFLYAIWRINKNNGPAGLFGYFAVVAIFIVLSEFMPSYKEILGTILICSSVMLVPVMCCVDIYRYRGWVRAVKCWLSMPEPLKGHPQIIIHSSKFDNLSHQKRIPITLFLVTIYWTVVIILNIVSHPEEYGL